MRKTSLQEYSFRGSYSRRSFLSATALGVIGLGTLNACSRLDPTPKPSPDSPFNGKHGTDSSEEPLVIGMLASQGAIETNPYALIRSTRDLLVHNLIWEPCLISSEKETLERGGIYSFEQEEPLRWLLHINDGTYFEDGSPVTPEDVQWSLEQFIDAKNSTIDPILPSVLPPYSRIEIERYETLGDRAMYLHTNKPYDRIPECVRYSCYLMQKGSTPETSLKTGPFRVHKWESDLVVLKRNEHYREGTVQAPEVQIRSYDNSRDIVDALVRGEINFAPDMDSKDLLQLASSQKVSLSNTQLPPIPRFHYQIQDREITIPIYIPKSSALRDARAIRALRILYDRQGYAQSVFGGFGQAGNDVLGSGDPHADGTLMRGQDAPRAKELLIRAGLGAIIADNSGDRTMSQTSQDSGAALVLHVLRGIPLTDTPSAAALDRAVDAFMSANEELGIAVKKKEYSLDDDLTESTLREALHADFLMFFLPNNDSLGDGLRNIQLLQDLDSKLNPSAHTVTDKAADTAAEYDADKSDSRAQGNDTSSTSTKSSTNKNGTTKSSADKDAAAKKSSAASTNEALFAELEELTDTYLHESFTPPVEQKIGEDRPMDLKNIDMVREIERAQFEHSPVLVLSTGARINLSAGTVRGLPEIPGLGKYRLWDTQVKHAQQR